MTNSPKIDDAIYSAHEAYRRARAAYDSVPSEAPESEHNAAGHEKDDTMSAFLLTPCRIEWALFEKFALFEGDAMHPDHFNGPSAAAIWFAALKRDALWLAHEYKSAMREVARLERDLARIRAIWRDVSHPEAEDAMAEMDKAPGN